MVILRCQPVDLIAFLSAPTVRLKLTVRPKLYAHLLIQVTAGEARAVYAVSDPSAPIAIAGLFAWPDRESEAWFMVDTARAAHCLPACLAAIRRALRQEAPSHSRGILARVEPGNRAGETIAKVLGFESTGDGIWRFAGCRTSSAICSEEALRKSC